MFCYVKQFNLKTPASERANKDMMDLIDSFSHTVYIKQNNSSPFTREKTSPRGHIFIPDHADNWMYSSIITIFQLSVT